jgi:ArsR family transcriptional regulator
MSTSKNLLYEKQAEIAKAIAHPLRIAVIDFLKDGERCVCDIAEHVGSERSNVSRHLAVMVNAGVLSCRKEGLKVFYWLRTPASSISSAARPAS